ncbi:hypothetical protein [Streptomyces sp. NPDC020983]|uniref:hypothetical protein n=1 Tax=Streptomyces sp. NPDC020983 TaxID=3365106 RepID=UPI00378D595F
MRSRAKALRAGALAAVLGTAAALLAAPAVHAQPADHVVRLNAGRLAALSARFTPRSDGTPGLVAAAAAGSTASPDPAATPPATSQSGTAPSAAASTSIDEQTTWQTARGAASTLALNGTRDWVAVFSGGSVARYDAHGAPVWQRTAHSLYTDWQVKPRVSFQTEEYTPVLYEGYDPYQPSSIGTHPYAQADFDGDGVADVAVAYSVGESPARTFTAPGSSLQSGTFLSVLDGRTGRMLWHTLVPGSVGSMLAQDGRLVVAERTGPAWDENPVAEQGDSRSSLTAYSFTGSGAGLTGHTDWTYNTHAPWADWTDVEPLSGGRITAGWTDTPLGLGSPRPPAGHVLVLDAATGRVGVDTRTPGYPRIVHQDPGSDRVLVAEQNDPFDAVRWDLTAIDARSGARSVLASRDGTIPEAFLVDQQAHGGQARYAVAELGIDPVTLADGQSTVSGWDEHGRTVWSHQTASTVGGPDAPTLSLQFDPTGHGQVVAAVADAAPVSAERPEGLYHAQLVAFDARDGGVMWHREGDVVGDQVTPYQGRLLTVGYDLTAWSVDAQHGSATQLPLLTDSYGAAATDVNGDGVEDLVVGGQSHGVFALDGRDLKSATPGVLWTAPVSAAVHQIRLAQVADRKGVTATRLVAATSHGFAVLDPRTGRVTADVNTGSFQYGVTVASGEIVATGARSVGAYTADGAVRWTYRPAGTTGKQVVYSVPATDGQGHLYLEYGGTRSGFGTGASDPAPTAVALDSAAGTQLWAERPSGDSAAWIEQQAGVFAGEAVPGAGGKGVAFAFGGDQPATGRHRVQIVDGATGRVVSERDSVGSSTFQGFAASKRYGLVELHAFEVTVHPADGGAPYDVHTMANVQQAAFATTTSGTETFVAGTGGLEQYAQPFPRSSDFVYATSEAFSQFAGTVTPLSPARAGAGTELAGLPFDWAAYDLNQNVGAYGANMLAPDSFPHGVTVQQVSDTAATSAKAAPRSAPKPPSTASAAATAIRNPQLPRGIVTPSLKIRSSVEVSPDDTTETTRGYTPQQIRARLGLTGDGSGQTLAIVDAYDYPAAASDLNHFAGHFGLPSTCDSVPAGTDCFDFQQVYADGTRPPADAGWQEEEALDIEWAHAVAPHAKIVLVEAADASAAGLYRAVDKAAALHPAVVSNSWGMTEFSEESFYDGHCKLTDAVCTQSTGDAGHPSGYSSTNPYALAIGGTSLRLDADGTTLGETAWSSTGGGLSYFEKRPAYQDGVQDSAFRATPDVSFVADPSTGVAVYTTAGGTAAWYQVGGTSLSAPAWGALLTAADQLRATAGKHHLAAAGPDGDTAHADVYALGGKLNDVTSGSNGACGTECTAGPGYDTVTGLGSPLAGVDTALATMK